MKSKLNNNSIKFYFNNTTSRYNTESKPSNFILGNLFPMNSIQLMIDDVNQAILPIKSSLYRFRLLVLANWILFLVALLGTCLGLAGRIWILWVIFGIAWGPIGFARSRVGNELRELLQVYFNRKANDISQAGLSWQITSWGFPSKLTLNVLNSDQVVQAQMQVQQPVFVGIPVKYQETP